MNKNDKPYPDVALIALCDEKTEEVTDGEESIYPDHYKDRYAINQIVMGKENEKIEKNLEFFKELDKKAKDLKVIKLHLECHGAYDTVPNSKKRLMDVQNPKYIDSVKAYLSALKKFMLKNKDVKLYISHDVCFGGRMYLRNGKFFDIFDDIKRELDGVLDRVALATHRNKMLEQRAPGRCWGLNSINDGIRRCGGVVHIVGALRRDNKQFESDVSAFKDLLSNGIARSNNLAGPDDKINNSKSVIEGAERACLWPIYSELSKKLNFRRYYFFDKDNKKKKFAANTKEAQKKKNEFLGLKKQNVPAKTNKETLAEMVAWLYRRK